MNEEVINKTENEELKGQLLNLFKEDKIDLDPEVVDVFNEVFDEFELANGEEDSINVYYKEDKEVFESDLTINNNYQIKVNGLSSGVYTATYTFIDNLEYAMNEKTDLVYDDTVIETLVDFVNKDARTMIRDENEWCIVVTERITLENGEYTRIPRLYIYVPVNMPEKNF